MAVITELNRRPDPNAVTKRQANRRTAILLVLCGIAAFAALIGQLAKIMIREHDYYESAAVENQVRSTVVTASRGTIYDTQGKILAQSATVETIYISPVEMRKYEEDPELIARGLSDILDVDYDWVMKKWDHTDHRGYKAVLSLCQPGRPGHWFCGNGQLRAGGNRGSLRFRAGRGERAHRPCHHCKGHGYAVYRI